MTQKYEGPRRVATLRRPVTTKVFHGRPNLITAVNLQTKTCGHVRPIVRNVVELDGPAAYVCRQCFAYLRTVEVRAVEIASVKRQFDNLFRGCWPQVSRPGAALTSRLEVAR